MPFLCFRNELVTVDERRLSGVLGVTPGLRFGLTWLRLYPSQAGDDLLLRVYDRAKDEIRLLFQMDAHVDNIQYD